LLVLFLVAAPLGPGEEDGGGSGPGGVAVGAALLRGGGGYLIDGSLRLRGIGAWGLLAFSRARPLVARGAGDPAQAHGVEGADLVGYTESDDNGDNGAQKKDDATVFDEARSSV